jgi:hypothetical protein
MRITPSSSVLKQAFVLLSPQLCGGICDGNSKLVKTIIGLFGNLTTAAFTAARPACLGAHAKRTSRRPPAAFLQAHPLEWRRSSAWVLACSASLAAIISKRPCHPSEQHVVRYVGYFGPLTDTAFPEPETWTTTLLSPRTLTVCHHLLAPGRREKPERLGVTRPEVHPGQPGDGLDIACLNDDRIDPHPTLPVRLKGGLGFLFQNEV